MKNRLITQFKFIFLLCLGIFIIPNAQSQVGINTTSPEGALDLSSTNNGLVFPRVALSSTIVEAPVTNPNGTNLAVGTVVYNTSSSQTGTNDVFPGLYVWDGSQWVGQFITADYQKFEQTAVVRTPRRNGPSATTANTDGITGLVNQTFTPKYSGLYKIKVSTNFAAGQINDFYSGDLISMGTTEGDFVFFLSGNGVSINPLANTESFEDGWIYMHAYAVDNDIEGINTEGIPHYSSVVYTEYLTAGSTYTFSLRANNYTGGNFATGAAGDSYVGRDLPCTVEFTYVDEQ